MLPSEMLLNFPDCIRHTIQHFEFLLWRNMSATCTFRVSTMLLLEVYLQSFLTLAFKGVKVHLCIQSALPPGKGTLVPTE